MVSAFPVVPAPVVAEPPAAARIDAVTDAATRWIRLAEQLDGLVLSSALTAAAAAPASPCEPPPPPA